MSVSVHQLAEFADAHIADSNPVAATAPHYLLNLIGATAAEAAFQPFPDVPQVSLELLVRDVYPTPSSRYPRVDLLRITPGLSHRWKGEAGSNVPRSAAIDDADPVP
jgi:hypothetical protein